MDESRYQERVIAVERALDAAISELEDVGGRGSVIADLIDARERYRELVRDVERGSDPLHVRIPVK